MKSLTPFLYVKGVSMKLKLFSLAFLAILFFAGTSFAAKTVPGDVLVIFKNPFSDIPVTQETLSRDSGVHAEYINSVAKSLDAKVSFIYEGFSVDGNNITALLHSDSRSETDLLFDLRMRDDVKSASLNRVKKPPIIIRRKTH